MIDFHSHIVYEVDDGSDSIENSIELLRQAKKVGFNKIILTPHYMQNYYEMPKSNIQEKIQKLEKIIKKEQINIELYQANEIYIANDITTLLNEEKASTINNSCYILFELPMNEEPPNLLEVIYTLLENRNIPIIAHPERYLYIQQNPNRLLELLELGVLFQANYGSILGLYGKQIEKTVNTLIKNNFIHFLGSDIHKTGNVYNKMYKIKKRLEKITTKEKIEELTAKNAQKVINNEKIEIEMPLFIKKQFRFFI